MDATAEEQLLLGSGWGTLEELIRRQDGDMTLSRFCRFPAEALGNAQQEWVTLLQEGNFPEMPVSEEPKGYLVDEKWRLRLRKAMEKEENRHWYSYMHLGLMEYAAGNLEEAKALMEQSFSHKENAWAARNLAMLWKNEYGDIQKAADYIRIAVRLNPNCRGILLETATVLLAAGESEQWIALYNSLPEKFQKDGRLKFNTALAYMKQENYQKATQYLNKDLVMPDIKEGDTAISDVWNVLYSHIVGEETGITDEKEIHRLVNEKYPLGELDFRTH
jgi:tetratricopeptide (TPR) repeat protein